MEGAVCFGASSIPPAVLRSVAICLRFDASFASSLKGRSNASAPRNDHLLFGVRHITIFFCFDASFASSLRVDRALFRHLFSFLLNYKCHRLTIAQLTHRSSLRENKRVIDTRHRLEFYITTRRRHKPRMFLARSDLLNKSPKTS